MKNVAFAFPLVCLLAAPVFAQDLASLVSTQLPGLIDTYKGLHGHPELSHREERTSALLAAELRKAGYTVTERVGKYPDGAKAMLADHLYERFGTPDFGVALHDTNLLAAGAVSLTSGPALASDTSVDVTMRGVGGHGSRPEAGKDPIVMSAAFIMQLQTIVSRQVDPRDPAVVTVGDIHGGTKRNIIPGGIRRTAQGVALSAGVPDDRAPIVRVLEDESTPVNYNDPALAARVRATLAKALNPQLVFDAAPSMGSEDFGILGLEGHKIPTVIFWLGAMEPAKFAAAKAAGKLLPGVHTSRFEPLPEPTLRTGITAMTSIAIALLQN